MLRQIAPQYIDTKKAKVIYRHMAQIGPESQWAAQAAECANDQGKFWPFVFYTYDHQGGENVGAFSKDNLKKFAQALELDPAQFNTCLDSGKYEQYVIKETAEGRQKGVQATPSLFINGQFFEGALPATQLTKLIDTLTPRK